MRTISKRSPPPALIEWREKRKGNPEKPGMECNYERLRADAAVLEALEKHLLAEQGRLCAYTGIRLQDNPGGFHLEHVVAQKHCQPFEDTAYSNLVACWPRPNHPSPPSFGARRKGDWPSPLERSLFISPLSRDCERRFLFKSNGEIAPVDGDDKAAVETISRLGLAHHELTGLRNGAIKGAIPPKGKITASEELRIVEKLLREMESDESKLNAGIEVPLRPFCFALRQHLERKRRVLRSIISQKRHEKHAK